jgi:hypothetical protein
MFSALLLLLSACATTPRQEEDAATSRPALALTPASLGQTLSLQQQLTVSHDGHRQRANALLEIDDSALKLALLVAQRRMLSVTWDGSNLTEERDPALPNELNGARFVDDIHLAYWPAAVIRAALPAGSVLTDSPRERILTTADGAVTRIVYTSDTRWLGHLVIEHGAGHVLEIDSALLQ